MIKISKKELEKLAKMSGLDLGKEEINAFIKDLENVLTYSQRVKEIASNVNGLSNKNINVFREDVVVKTDPRPIIEQGPEIEADLFATPGILGDLKDE